MLYAQHAALALAATTLAASGCGSSKAEASKAPTRAEFTATADTICRNLNTKVNSLKFATKKDFERALPNIATWAQIESEELNKLTPAAGMEYEWRKFLVGSRVYAEQNATLANYAKSHKVSNSSPLFTKTLITHGRLGQIAKKNGFKDCSQIP